MESVQIVVTRLTPSPGVTLYSIQNADGKVTQAEAVAILRAAADDMESRK